MKRFLSLVAFVGCGSMAVPEAWAQYGGEEAAHSLRVFESMPGRTVVRGAQTTEAYTGVFTDLSTGTAFDTWALPVGGSFGLFEGFEVGVNTQLRLKPWALQTFIGSFRLYGRLLLIPDTLAAEVAIHVPTAFTNAFGVEALVPARLQLGQIEVYGQGQLMYSGSAFSDTVTFGVAATALIPVVDPMFVAVDLGFGIAANKLDLGLPGTTAEWATNIVFPVGVGAGAEILPGLLVKGVFLFTDVATEDAMFDGRAMQIVLVHRGDLAG